MRLFLFIFLFLLSSCGSSQRLVTKETKLYPNIFYREYVSSFVPVTIDVTRNMVIFRSPSLNYIVDKGRFMSRSEGRLGGYMAIFEGKIDDEIVAVLFHYSQRGDLLSVGIRRGFALALFIVNYETIFTNEVHR